MPDVKRTAPNKTHTQSVIFDKKKWTVDSAKEWLNKHDFFIDGLDVTDTQLRFRQFNPSDKFEYITQNIGKGISLIIGYLK